MMYSLGLLEEDNDSQLGCRWVAVEQPGTSIGLLGCGGGGHDDLHHNHSDFDTYPTIQFTNMNFNFKMLFCCFFLIY